MKFYVTNQANGYSRIMDNTNVEELQRQLHAEDLGFNVDISMDADSFLKHAMPYEVILAENMKELEYENEHVQIKNVGNELHLTFKNIFRLALPNNMPVNIITYMQYLKIKQFIYYAFGEPNVNHSK